MNLGRELVACAVREGTLRPFLEAGISPEWLTDERDLSRAAIFGPEDLDAYNTLLRHWESHSKVPAPELFERSHPAEAYPLPKSSFGPDELIEIFQQDRRRYLTELAVSDLADLLGEGKVDEAADLMESAVRVIRDTHASKSITVMWDGPEYDLESRINREVVRGIKTGIKGLDSQDGFYGFQPGNFICYLGRAKAGKTSFALLSAINAWLDGKRVLFLTFEIAAGKLPSEPGVADRLDCFGAGVDLLHYMMGELTREEQAALRDFRKYCDSSAFKIVQPTSRYTVTDLESEVDRFEPDVVYVDGFYFMTDRITGKPGANWEGQDNLAGELKTLAMTNMIPVVITHQVREKQLTGKKGKGIDDSAMMGGTAIIMYADLVLGADVDEDKTHTISCTRARLKYLDTIHGKWDWKVCAFGEVAAPVDEDQFGYGREDDNELAPF